MIAEKSGLVDFWRPTQAYVLLSGGREMDAERLEDGRLPLISVVVAVFNGAATIEKLLLSVINNTYKKIDLIVMDGGSTDGTLDILNRYSSSIKVWRSEKDKGIYDALNKGLSFCEPGSYVLILGADDRLLVLDEVVDSIQREKADLLVTNVQQKNISFGRTKPYKCFLPSSINSSNFLNFPMHHQGFLFERSDRSPQKFDLQLGLHSDYEFMASAVAMSTKPVYVDTLLAEYSTGGASDYFSLKNLRSLNKVAKSLKLNRLKIVCSSPFKFLRMLLKLMIPRNIIDLVRRFGRA